MSGKINTLFLEYIRMNTRYFCKRYTVHALCFVFSWLIQFVAVLNFPKSRPKAETQATAEAEVIQTTAAKRDQTHY